MSDLQQITGIGPTRADRLANEAGILTLADLAVADTGDVADLLVISEEAAFAMIEEAAWLMRPAEPAVEIAPDDAAPPADDTAVYEHFLTGRVKR